MNVTTKAEQVLGRDDRPHPHHPLWLQIRIGAHDYELMGLIEDLKNQKEQLKKPDLAITYAIFCAKERLETINK